MPNWMTICATASGRVLERYTWRPARHMRQLVLLLRANGIESDGPLSEADCTGLPLPQKVWDDAAA